MKPDIRQSMPAKPRDRVEVHFTGYHADGSPFGTSRDGEPLSFSVGSDEVIAGLSEAVTGMEVGDTARVSIPAEHAYGPRDAKLLMDVPREVVGDHAEPGDPIRTELNGQPVVLWLVAVNGDTATLDANHPLAGETLTYDLELMSISPR